MRKLQRIHRKRTKPKWVPAPSVLSASALSVTKLQTLQPFECKMYYYDVVRQEDFEKEYNVEYATRRNLRKCDIISYHVPVLDSTRGMINKEAIDGWMKQDAIIVNVARGDLMNNADVAEALNAGKIFVAMDVIAPETPEGRRPLIQLKRNRLGTFLHYAAHCRNHRRFLHAHEPMVL